jgi:hypothetical protein
MVNFGFLEARAIAEHREWNAEDDRCVLALAEVVGRAQWDLADDMRCAMVGREIAEQRYIIARLLQRLPETYHDLLLAESGWTVKHDELMPSEHWRVPS